ncbi:FecCD family ABC transporter permease [Dermabacteraceae bacterium P7074]
MVATDTRPLRMGRKAPLSLLAGLLLLFAAVCASFALGARAIPLPEVWSALHGVGAPDVVVTVTDLRLGRTLLGLLAGSALGAAGVLMQSLTRNPIADPGLLGVNAGAAFGVALAITLFGTLSQPATILAAFTGAGLAAGVVFVFAGARNTANSPVRLTLSGVAIAAILAGFTHALVATNERVLDEFRFWRVGSLLAHGLRDVAWFLPAILVGLLLTLFLSRTLDTIALGDDSALALGVNPARTRLVGLFAVTILAGTATALVGPITFVGLAVPHLVRRVVGPRHTLVVPLSILIAPALLLLADVVGRLIGGYGEVPVGVVTALIGAPLLALMVIFGGKGKLG